MENKKAFHISVEGFFCCVDLPGLEPRKPEPKTGVLPLHHRSIPNCDAKVRPCSQKIKHRSKKKRIIYLPNLRVAQYQGIIMPIPSKTLKPPHESSSPNLAKLFLDRIQ